MSEETQHSMNPVGQALKECPFCSEMIPNTAKKCKFCGEIVDPVLREIENLKRQQQQQQQSNNNPIIVNNNNNNNNNNQQAPIAPQMPFAIVPKSRLTFVLLGIFLGVAGVHNFYIGHVLKRLIQLAISITGFGMFITAIWVLIEICVVKTDARGIPMV